MGIKTLLKKTWNFLWYEDSFASFAANIIVAFVLVKFIVYPIMGFAFGTNLPLVAVVSSSMHHDASFDTWWENANIWYVNNNIPYDSFIDFPLKNGFNKGDIMIVTGATIDNTQIGDIVIFDSNRPNPIIHRVVDKYEANGKIYYQTKGDNYKTNPRPLKTYSIDETKVPIESIQGKALLRIPFVGYVKILAIEFINWFI